MAFNGLRILSTTERPRIGPNSTIQRVMVVVIRTDLGNEGSLEIPVQQFEAMTDEELAGVIASKAAMLDRVHNL